MRGGVPPYGLLQTVQSRVFPTCVGVFRVQSRRMVRAERFPHMRGGVPCRERVCALGIEFSPHAWGCSAFTTDSIERNDVFPTCVGVFRLAMYPPALAVSFPHMRGGVPLSPIVSGAQVQFSPHAWGCSGYEGAYTAALASFPHMRGGVPHAPRAWR